MQVNLNDEDAPTSLQRADEPSIYQRLENGTVNCRSDQENDFGNDNEDEEDDHGSDSPPRSVKVINMDDDEEQ